MAQITLYVPDEVAERLRRDAKRAGKSLSAYMTELATRREGRSGRWPSGFFDLFGSCELPAADDSELLPLDEPPPL